MGTPRTPALAVVIPTCNRGASLVAAVRSVLAELGPDDELVVVDDAGDDATAAALTGLGGPGLRLLRHPTNRGPAAARNTGVAATVAELVAFVDDDVVVEPGWRAALVAPFGDPAVLGVEGRIVYGPPGHVWRFCDRVVWNGSGGLYMTANAAYRRTALGAVGGFNEELRRHQDRALGLAVAARGPVVFCPAAVVVHEVQAHSVRSFWNEARGAGYLAVVVADYEHRRVYRPRRLLGLLVPFVGFLELRKYRVRSALDLALLLLYWPRLWAERIELWRASARRGRFVL